MAAEANPNPSTLTAEQVAQIAAGAAGAVNREMLPAATAPILAALAEQREFNQKLLDRFRPPMGAAGVDDNGVAGGDHGNTKSVIRVIRKSGGIDIVFDSVGKDLADLGAIFRQARRQRSRIFSNTKEWDGEKVEKTSSVGVDATAGFLVPTEFANVIWEKAFDDSFWLQNAQILPMASDSMEAAQLVQVFGSSPSYDSGIDFTASDESGAKTENTNPSFKLRAFRAKKVRGLQKVTRDLLKDSPMFMGWLTNKLASAWARYIDSKVWSGNGNTEMLGFLNAAGLASSGARTTANRFKLDDAIHMDAAIDEAFGEDLVWLMRKATNTQLPLDVDSQLQPKVKTDWADVAGALTRKRQLLGYPVVMTKQAPALGTKGDVTLASPKAYAIGMREGFELEVNSDRYWDEDIVGVMVRSRMDGQPIYPDGICPLTA